MQQVEKWHAGIIADQIFSFILPSSWELAHQRSEIKTEKRFFQNPSQVKNLYDFTRSKN